MNWNPWRQTWVLLAVLFPLHAQTGSCIDPHIGGGATIGETYGVVGLPYSVQFVLNPGHLATHTGFEVQAATNLPPGFSFNAATGMLAGTPTATGWFRIVLRVDTVPASNVYCGIDYPIVINNPMSVAGLLPPASVGAPYMAWPAENGSPPYTFLLTGGALPAGVSFDSSTSEFVGTPTAQGTYTFAGTVGDTLGESAKGQYSMVVGPPGGLSVTASAVNLQGRAGGAVQTFPLGVAMSDLESVQFTAAVAPALSGTPPSWLKLTPTSGSTPTRVLVQADPGKLPQGVYQGQIQIAAKSGTLLSIPVTFNVADSSQSFAAAPAGIKITTAAQADLSQPVSTPVQVWNTGGASVTVTATGPSQTSGSGWATVAPSHLVLASGESGAFTVSVDAQTASAGGAKGTYFATIQLKGPNQEVDIPVQLNVSGTYPQPYILVSPPAVSMGSYCDPVSHGTAHRDIGAVGVTDPIPGTTYSYALAVQGFGGAVQVTPTSGTASTYVTATYVPCQLGFGKHTGYLEVTAPGMSPSKVYQKLEITIGDWTTANDYGFSKESGGNNPNVSSGGIVMTADAGQTGSVTTQFTVTGSDDAPLQFSVGVGADAAGWATIYPTRGVATGTPTTVTVIVDPTKAPAGATQAGDMVDVTEALGYTMAVPKSLAGVFLNPTVGPVSAFRLRTQDRPALVTCTASKIIVVPADTPSYFSHRVDWPKLLQARVVDDCGKPVTGASVTASFSNGDPGLSLDLKDANTGLYAGTWRPGAVAASVTATLRAMKTGFATAASPVYGAVIDDPGVPVVTANGVVNNLNPVLGAPLAPGTVASIYGSNLATSTAQATTVPLPTTLGNTQVLIGGIPAPLFFVSPGQINVQIPPELTADTAPDILVLSNGRVSIPQTVQLAAVSPGIAVYNNGRAIAQHGDYSLVTLAAPAHPGEYIVLYLVGMGSTAPAVASNQQAPSSPLAWTSSQPTVTIDGATSQVGYAGLTPGGIGLYQINCQVPKGARTGDLPIVISQGATRANATTLPVAP